MLATNKDWRNRFLTVTNLDKFKEYMSGFKWNGDYYSDVDFVSNLLWLTPTTPKMYAGIAVHKFLQDGLHKTFTRTVVDGWSINVVSLEIKKIYVPQLVELPVSIDLGYGFTLRGRIDGLDHDSIRDIKTTSYLDTSTYMHSYQWKSYLLMTSRSRFVYQILKVKVDEDKKTVDLQGYSQLEQYSYPGMEQDVRDCVNAFVNELDNLKSLIIEVEKEHSKRSA